MGKLLNLKTAPANRASIIDEFGDVSAARKAFAPTEKRYEQLREEIKSWYADSPPDKAFIEKGTRWQLDVSACANATLINIRAAYKKLGLAKFLQVVSVTLKALAAFLTEPEIEALTTTSRAGARAIAATPMGAPVLNGIATREPKASDPA